MKRRNLHNFLLLVAVTGIMLAFLLSFAPPKKKNIGLQLYSVRDSISRDMPGAIEKVARMGYAFVESAGYANGKFYGLDPAEFKALLEKNGLYMLSSHTGQNPPADGNLDKVMEWWDQCIDAHAAAGAKYIVQPFMGRDAYQSLCDLLREKVFTGSDTMTNSRPTLPEGMFFA